MWAETSKYLQQEFDNAGVDIQVPKELPTRANISREIGRAISPVTKPIQDAIDEVAGEVKQARRLATPTPNAARREPVANTGAKAAPATNGSTQPAAETPAAPPANTDPSQNFGAWGGTGNTEG